MRLTTEDGSAIGVCIDSLTTLLSSKCSACLLVYLTCIEGDDYSSFVQDIVFSPGSVEFDVTIIIHGDILFENVEDFFHTFGADYK